MDGRWNWQCHHYICGGGELRQFTTLMNSLGDVFLSYPEDRWWEICDNGCFTVSDKRRWIDDVILPKLRRVTRWNSFIPKNVNILIWRVHLDKILTRYNVNSRWIDVPSILCPICSILCPICLLDVEQFDHLFVKGEVVARIWNVIFKRIYIQQI